MLLQQCSHEENFEWMNWQDDGTRAVKIANPKTLEFQVVRSSLLPGLLKTVRENRSHSLPIRIFETSDIVVKDTTLERQARNIRHAAALWCNKTAGFEVVHGMLDRLMKMLEIPRISAADHNAKTGYYIKERNGKSIYRPSLDITLHSTQTPPFSLAARQPSITGPHRLRPQPRAILVQRKISKSVHSESCTRLFSKSSRLPTRALHLKSILSRLRKKARLYARKTMAPRSTRVYGSKAGLCFSYTKAIEICKNQKANECARKSLRLFVPNMPQINSANLRSRCSRLSLRRASSIIAEWCASESRGIIGSRSLSSASLSSYSRSRSALSERAVPRPRPWRNRSLREVPRRPNIVSNCDTKAEFTGISVVDVGGAFSRWEVMMPRSQRLTRQKPRREVRRMNHPELMAKMEST